MDESDVAVMEQSTYLPVPETNFFDIFSDTWVLPEDVELTPLYSGYKGRLMDTGRMQKAFRKAVDAFIANERKTQSV